MNIDNDIIELYKNNISATDISKITNRHITTIFRILKKHSIATKNKKVIYSVDNVPLEVGTKIITLYKSGLSATKIAEMFNTYHGFILKYLRLQNIDINSASSMIRRYNINESFFDLINSEETAYFLGLLFADGCNDIKRKRFLISLQENDIDILEQFKYYLSSTVPLEFIRSKNNRKNQYRLTICSKRISEQLSNLGCVGNKSLILLFPQYLYDSIYIRHFIRGYFDGDGSILGYIKKKKNTPTFTWALTSTKDFCNNVKSILERETNSHFYIQKTHNNITCTLSSGGNIQVQRIMNWLYKDATIFLKRKHDKYIELCNINSRQNYR